jgi:hypothetical protein
MKTTILSVALLCICLPGFAKDQPVLKPMKVISQEIGAHNGGTAVMPIGTSVVGVPITRRSNIVVIEGATRRVTLSEIGNKFIVLPVNGIVQCYQDKNLIVIPDSSGKKHKFSVLHVEVIANEKPQ